VWPIFDVFPLSLEVAMYELIISAVSDLACERKWLVLWKLGCLWSYAYGRKSGWDSGGRRRSDRVQSAMGTSRLWLVRDDPGNVNKRIG